MNDTLTKLRDRALKVKTTTIIEGVPLLVRKLTAAQVNDYVSKVTSGQITNLSSMARLAHMGIADASGGNVFPSPDDAANIDFETVKMLAEEVAEFNGLLKNATEKKSDSTN